jgi:hypothetical protein
MSIHHSDVFSINPRQIRGAGVSSRGSRHETITFDPASATPPRRMARWGDCVVVVASLE